MLELVRAADQDTGHRELWAMQMGGDAYNFAVYLARGGIDTAFMTALGTDGFSEAMRRRWREEDGLDVSFVATIPDRVPGLYAIETAPDGERDFTYWRDRSAVRALFDAPGAAALLDRAGSAELLYVSGITLSLYDQGGQQALRGLAEAVRASGGQVAFDTNYRARGWASRAAAAAAVRDFAPLVTIALPTFNDEAEVFGDGDANQTAARWRDWGADIVAIKLGGMGAMLATRDTQWLIPTVPQGQPRDTTGAGDSFNGAFLAALLMGASPEDAVRAGHRLAGAVIRHQGAIIPRDAMPDRAG